MNLSLLRIDGHILKELFNIFIVFFLLMNLEEEVRFIVIVIFMITHLIKKNAEKFTFKVLWTPTKQTIVVSINGDECLN